MLQPKETINWTDAGTLPALVTDYIAQKESIAFLTKYPFELDAFAQVIADKQNDSTNRAVLVDVLRSQYSTIPTTNIVTANIELLLESNTFTVTAAHQPCLFLGPLYNVYKIASAIALANQLKQQYTQCNFVPVFWLGSEDHDVEELNHVFVNGKKITWEGAGTGASGRWGTATMQAAIEELKATVNQPEVIAILEEAVKRYATFGRLSQYFVNELFKQHGLVVLDQDDARLKQLFAGYIKDEVLNSRATKVLKPTVDFLEANYKAQAKPRDINFFYLGEGYRERIVLNETSGRYEVNNKDILFSRDEIVAEIENHPERFSPNVIFRPLYQELILPNLAFVGGAGELSYWLELKPLFDYHKVNYPMLAMRSSVALLTPPVLKKLEKLGLTAVQFLGDVEQLINNYVKQGLTDDANLAVEKQKAEAFFEAIIAKAEKTDATLKQSATTEKQKLLTALDNLEGKMLKAEKRKQETTVNQIRSIQEVLFPGGIGQERHENFIPFYHPDFIDELIPYLNPLDKQFKVFVKE